MTRDKKTIWIFGIAFGIFGCFFYWAGSDYELPELLQYIWVILLLPVYFAGLMFKFPEFMLYPLVFFWWFLIGRSVGFVFVLIRKLF